MVFEVSDSLKSYWACFLWPSATRTTSCPGHPKSAVYFTPKYSSTPCSTAAAY